MHHDRTGSNLQGFFHAGSWHLTENRAKPREATRYGPLIPLARGDHSTIYRHVLLIVPIWHEHPASRCRLWFGTTISFLFRPDLTWVGLKIWRELFLLVDRMILILLETEASNKCTYVCISFWYEKMAWRNTYILGTSSQEKKTVQFGIITPQTV